MPTEPRWYRNEMNLQANKECMEEEDWPEWNASVEKICGALEALITPEREYTPEALQ